MGWVLQAAENALTDNNVCPKTAAITLGSLCRQSMLSLMCRDLSAIPLRMAKSTVCGSNACLHHIVKYVRKQ